MITLNQLEEAQKMCAGKNYRLNAIIRVEGYAITKGFMQAHKELLAVESGAQLNKKEQIFLNDFFIKAKKAVTK